MFYIKIEYSSIGYYIFQKFLWSILVMKYSKTFIPTSKEVPRDATISSHILMLRSGMIKKLSSGVYSILPIGLKVLRKIEEIIREEMNNIGSIEFSLPVLIPAELWKKSGRWYAMGPELMRLKDRNQQDFVLSPTHEEVFTEIMNDHIKSYRDLPMIVYQIGLKFRDEIRPRFGVMRAKTFIMKDAYSFHEEEDWDSLQNTYSEMSAAYKRIFNRCGLETIPVQADSGAMGGNKSEEFMVPSHIGEEEIVQCPSCGYVANIEKATSKINEVSYKDCGNMELLHTPNVKTIEDLSKFVDKPPENLIKTMVYKTDEDQYIMALIRGDLNVNETKLKNYLGVAEIFPAEEKEIEEKLKIPPGFMSPIGLDGVRVIADESVRKIKCGVCGGNKKDYHYIKVNIDRDIKNIETFIDIKTVKEGDLCINCGQSLKIFRGIELGHIFQLGDKYTKAFSMTYLDETGKEKHPIMGCYGIGVERTAAAIIEQNHDEDGIIWPITVAPYHLYILPIKYNGQTKEVSDRIYNNLMKDGYEIILDDRDIRPGVKFKDADLLGIPFRLTIGDKGLAEGKVELYERRTKNKELISVDTIEDKIKQLFKKEFKKYS